VIIWLNGTFGVGKTTTAAQLVGDLPDARLFDPEYVGYLVAEHLRDHQFTDFQQLAPPAPGWCRPQTLSSTRRNSPHPRCRR